MTIRSELNTPTFTKSCSDMSQNVIECGRTCTHSSSPAPMSETPCGACHAWDAFVTIMVAQNTTLTIAENDTRYYICIVAPHVLSTPFTLPCSLDTNPWSIPVRYVRISLCIHSLRSIGRVKCIQWNCSCALICIAKHSDAKIIKYNITNMASLCRLDWNTLYILAGATDWYKLLFKHVWNDP
jgi:hypothetical protein